MQFLPLDSLGFFNFGVVMVKVGVIAEHGGVLLVVLGFHGELVFLGELVVFVVVTLKLFRLLLLCWWLGSVAFFSSGVAATLFSSGGGGGGDGREGKISVETREEKRKENII